MNKIKDMSEKLDPNLDNLDRAFPDDFTPALIARGKTIFYKRLAEIGHRFYQGKTQIMPKIPVPGFNWFNVWYTPGVSRISTAIRDDHAESFALTNRGNLVAVVSDSTRVLGDGDVTPAGGLGVMEGKAFLMKFLAGIDAVALCIDSRNQTGVNDPEIIIDFVKRIQHSFGAINLEDISQPNCFRVLDALRDDCLIPVWHDDAQGTASVLLAGLLNALKLAGKKIGDVKIVYLGAGAANTACVRLNILCGADPQKTVIFDQDGALTPHRTDFRDRPAFYQQWRLCLETNPRGIQKIEAALKNADVLIAYSKPGPDTIVPDWIRRMADKPIVFAGANPVPEIYPYAAKEAGAFIVGTGRGDFPNQLNNSIGFPGILKGALLVRARKITDAMAIAAARSLAGYAERRGISPDNIVPSMTEPELFSHEAADVGTQAIKDGVAQVTLNREEIFRKTGADIEAGRKAHELMIRHNLIPSLPTELIQEALDGTVAEIRKQPNN
jgi:malate dehydrogenase (oxaloacetate-decarboxylating)